ncbi:hypothetical protein ACOMHN_008998 [Nucella lapillus]
MDDQYRPDFISQTDAASRRVFVPMMMGTREDRRVSGHTTAVVSQLLGTRSMVQRLLLVNLPPMAWRCHCQSSEVLRVCCGRTRGQFWT